MDFHSKSRTNISQSNHGKFAKISGRKNEIFLMDIVQQYQETKIQKITHGKKSKNIKNQNFNISLMDFFD